LVIIIIVTVVVIIIIIIIHHKSGLDRPVPSSVEEMLQNMQVQRLTGGNLTTGLPSGRLITHPSELNITFTPQCKDYRTAKKLVGGITKRKLFHRTSFFHCVKHYNKLMS
jgi:hypothetical protein